MNKATGRKKKTEIRRMAFSKSCRVTYNSLEDAHINDMKQSRTVFRRTVADEPFTIVNFPIVQSQ